MTFKKTIITTDLAPAAVGTYSQGVVHNDTFYFSGQIGLDPIDMKMKEGFEAQMKQILANIDELLKSQDLSRQNIIKTSIFVTDLSNFGIVNEAYLDYFEEPFPARSCIEAPRLPKDALVEIEVIAAK